MKTLLSLVVAVCALVTANAQGTRFYVTNNLADSNHIAITRPFVLESVTLSTTNSLTPTIVRLIDGYMLRTNAAYTNYTSYLTNRTYSYVTSLGTTNTGTNSVLYYQANVVAASTTAVAEPTATMVVTSLEPVTFVPLAPIPFTKFLTLSNDQDGVNVVVGYRLP